MVWTQIQGSVRQENGITNIRSTSRQPKIGKTIQRTLQPYLDGSITQLYHHTTHDKTIYRTTYKGELIFMLRQVDDFAMTCDNEDTAKEIYIIGASLRLPKENKDPFAYLGLAEDYNEIDIQQARVLS